MKLIQTQTLGSAQPSITFSSIPGNFTDIQAVLTLRATTTNSTYRTFGVLLSLNGSTTGFATRALDGSGSSASSFTETRFMARMPDNAVTANTFGNISIYFPNYAGSSNKSYSVDSVTENNETVAYQTILAGLWSNTAAINSATFTAESGNFAIGSTISLYGIGGTGDGWAPKATGGIIQRVGNYWVHTFTASGTFTPTTALTDVEYLVVAGGGGGGGEASGGGGAGGYRSSVIGESSGGGASAESTLSLTAATNYTVTVGAGGAGAAGSNTRGTNGVNSTFSTITSTGGGGGGSYDALSGNSGGSGGGGDYAGGSGRNGAGTANQGFAGGGAGSGGTGSDFAGGGGGGAGEAGGTDGFRFGGDGLSSSITGTATFRAGGGSGGGGTALAVADGGLGGGGVGARRNVSAATPGTANTGAGGGGGDAPSTVSPTSGGSGGSGIVIVRYPA